MPPKPQRLTAVKYHVEGSCDPAGHPMFYTFSQNNSGGRFTADQKLRRYVIVEATSAVAANSLAEDIGLYFDGCSKGYDCPCCGDRWYPQWRDDNGSDAPQAHVAGDLKFVSDWKKSEAVIYYLDGSIKYADMAQIPEWGPSIFKRLL